MPDYSEWATNDILQRELGQERARLRWLTKVIVWAALYMLTGLFLVVQAYAHEHQPGETTEQQQVVEWLRNWKRPKGIFTIEHRMQGCCYVQGVMRDCFPVAARRVVNGILEVKPAFGELNIYDRWYKVDTKVNEDLQDDPRDSPDGQSYVCINGNQVVCFVEGAGT